MSEELNAVRDQILRHIALVDTVTAAIGIDPPPDWQALRQRWEKFDQTVARAVPRLPDRRRPMSNPFDYDGSSLGEASYLPDHQGSWQNVDETRPPAEVAGLAGAQFAPPASPLSETAREPLSLRDPSGNTIIDAEPHDVFYSTDPPSGRTRPYG
jgi:hypothetical protein